MNNNSFDNGNSQPTGWQAPPQGQPPYGQPDSGWQTPPQGQNPYGQPNGGWQTPPQGYNPYGQPNGGWQTPPGYSPNAFPYADWYRMYVEQRMLEERRYQEKERIKLIGKKCGLAALLYVALSYGLVYGLLFVLRFIPGLSAIITNTTAYLAFDVITSIISLGLPFVLAYFLMKKKQIVTKLPYQKPSDAKSSKFLTMLAIPTMVFSSIIINVISSIIQSFMGITFSDNMLDNDIITLPSMIMLSISVAVIPAVIEEFAIRGVVMQPLRRYGDKFAIIVSALFFSLLHGNMLQIPYTFAGGLILGYLMVKTKSMWPPMILHFVNNGYSVVIMIVGDIFGDRWGNLSAYIMWIGFAVIGVIGLIGYLKTKNNDEQLSEGESILKTSDKIVAFISSWQMVAMIIVFVYMAYGSISF